ncbi:NACHT domain-containing protein [Mesorhizobium sp. M7A.F.Ca.MR.245.00.0.0]|uniref:NACHT domain-containing protein n=1 Tax=Mesorhizobium sp. M7A.F.Ca.MR.245.00.0.0 TaxID=2496778 RepID=UPI000FCA7217|nr:NACHT domain-containing protein [Mesorhizobium sp. M7A.F.Ca.MR.245.00.0.0]RUV24098.1 NACHT domain-containing protein [Mesorhizobium sp. M7A.F.Ca.MR.245.00.0.0]RUV51617.1 NACHT domain-containing protein [Mesorhizobium sp. M7A.F.Ca.MR.228.00.0.0]
MLTVGDEIDTVRASRAGHTFHERWAARRALQLVFPNDSLFAIAVEGLSSTETATPGAAAEEVADLVLYYGDGDNFSSCDRLETVQFKYKVREDEVTSSFLKKTIGKFCDTLVGYEKEFTADEINRKASFIFVTNAPFARGLWDAITALKDGTKASDVGSGQQAAYLRALCAKHGVTSPQRLFARTEFRAAEKSLSGQSNALRRTLVDWSAGADAQAKNRLHDLQELVLKKAGPSGQHKNLIKREDVLDALDCLPEDLFPADTRFIDVGAVVERAELAVVGNLVKGSEIPVFLHAEGGVGKTVFVQNLAGKLSDDFEIVVFDCFGGGAYRSEEHSRHLPSIGIVQIVNELASRGLCDLLLPGSDDSRKVLKAARKRLAQAAKAIQTQSGKRGLFVIIDAADNAQLEADFRHEDAFPKLLLSSVHNEPINGVKLLLTARTHRKDSVIARAKVEPFELGPFTETETRQFLEDRKSGFSDVDFATAIARSGRNARVLNYLVQTWDVNVKGDAPATPITVPEIIAQQCEKIFSDLDTAGWPESEVREFFVALSLLPPPIPLDDLADALGWSGSQVSTAASDLAPMLEVTPHGAIFRDEPTETYVRDTYAGQTGAQSAIADRLMVAQARSTYAAEALPHFLVVIGDSNRAFALTESSEFPAAIQSEFGRRRLTLARLRAAYKLAVVGKDYDRTLNVVMRLAQAATANMRGDEFIRRSPALAVKLGDPDAQRRLFADRSGWRGARSARLTISHSFSGDQEEALIQRESTIRWINWSVEQPTEERPHDREGPAVNDFAAVLFHTTLQGGFDNVDRNLARWNFVFSLSASDELLRLLEQYELTMGETVLADFISFVASDQCTSLALKMRLLSLPRFISRMQARALAKSLERVPASDDKGDSDTGFREERGVQNEFIQAALAALLLSSRASAKAIVKNAPSQRPSGHDYTERYGHSKVWRPVLAACVRAWSDGKPLTYHHLLPNELKVAKRAKAIASKKDLIAFLEDQILPVRSDVSREKGRRKKIARPKARYGGGERDEISAGIEMILAVIRPIQSSVLSKEPLSTVHIAEFVSVLKPYIRNSVHWRSGTSTDLLARTVGLACIELLFTYAANICAEQAEAMVGMISSDRFGVDQKLRVLEQLARRPAFHDLAGRFAQHVSEQIRKDENIGNRGESYADLATALVPMSIDEAREYYRQGLAQLDQMGGEDYQQIYSLLHYAARQSGGPVAPALAQRLMNLCQVIAHDEPSKFGWTLFGRAASMSIGLPAIAKLVRWHNQDVAQLSYGLPQLACFLAKAGRLSPARAAFLLTICEDHGWWDWQVGDGVSDLLGLSNADGQRRIVRAVLQKLRVEHTSGAWPTLWESILKAGDNYPGVLTSDEQDALRQLRDEAERKQDEYNSRNNSPRDSQLIVDDQPTKEQVDDAIRQLAEATDHTSSTSIDEALKKIDEDKRLTFGSRIEFIRRLRSFCPYGKRLEFLFAVCDASEWDFDRSVDTLIDSVADWRSSSAHLGSNTTILVARLFESKGAELFYEGYSNVSRRIHQLSQFCGDERYVLDQVLKKVASDEIELDGDEWLQFATSLCNVASGDAARSALELILSGSASRIADEIGEGVHRAEQQIPSSEAEFLADVVWHLLGDDDAYVRWNIARGFTTLVDLGLELELGLLLDRFDTAEIPALASTGRMLPYQNSQEWLLIGIARAALRHGPALAFLRPRLVALARRNDVHVMHKVHIARCLENIGYDDGTSDVELQTLRAEIDAPKQGIVVRDSWATPADAKSGFAFDYEFNKTEIEDVARMFGISHGAAVDALSAEITSRWPEAHDLNYFGGHDRYRRDRHDRYEYAREHAQKHALFSAVTKMAATTPVVVRSYESDYASPWLEWRDRHDITFEDGSWLSDRKDSVPKAARHSLLGRRDDQQETLQDQDTLLTKIGLMGATANDTVPLYGRWSSADGVSIKIVAALTQPKGAVGRCASFSKLPRYDFWLPELWDEGYYDHRRRDKSIFEPLIWAPENHNLGIDQGDEIAAHNAASRPRLGIDLTERLALSAGSGFGEWHTKDRSLALKSQVWGGWHPDRDQPRYRNHEDGEILWASQGWLDGALMQLDRRLVYTITFWKYRSSRDYDTSCGVKSVLVGLRTDAGQLRLWPANKASLQD